MVTEEIPLMRQNKSVQRKFPFRLEISQDSELKKLCNNTCHNDIQLAKPYDKLQLIQANFIKFPI